MPSDVEIWNLLNKVKISEVTQSQLNEMTSRIAVDEDAIKFWSGVITVARAIGESRTFSHGLPIYDASAMSSVTVADSASGTIKPTGTEVWQLQSVNLDNCSVALTDGSGFSGLVLGGPDATVSGPIYLTSTLYVVFNNASGSEQTPSISYHKVSL